MVLLVHALCSFKAISVFQLFSTVTVAFQLFSTVTVLM